MINIHLTVSLTCTGKHSITRWNALITNKHLIFKGNEKELPG